jgi:predicted nuclease of predicted toxin-antitoxin system
MLKILVDENIPSRTVEELRRLGHDVRDFRGTDDQGIPDHIAWQRACDEGRLLVTTDKGFVHHWGQGHSGVLVVRLRQPNEDKNTPSCVNCLAAVRGRRVAWPNRRDAGYGSKHQALRRLAQKHFGGGVGEAEAVARKSQAV